MALPAIAPYPLPDVDRLPANRVAWRPDPARSVLLVHDMQHYFVDRFAVDAPPVPQVIDHIGRLRARCHELGVPVVYTAQPGDQAPTDRGLLTDFWGPGLPGDPRAGSIVDAIAPTGRDVLLTKWRYSAFVRSDLPAVLGGRDQLIITGVYAHIGVAATACDAFMRDIQAFVVADAVADFSADDHRNALAYVAGRCGAVVSTADALDAFAGELLGVSR